jgi:hypothetical protein
VPSAAEASRWIVLDEDDRIVDVSEEAEPVFGPLLGESLWERFPTARDVFAPYCEQARRTGQDVEVVEFFEGTLKRVRYSPRGSRVTAIWENLAAVDVSSLAALQSSLRAVVAALAEAERGSSGERPPLRVVQGGV